MSNVIQLSDYRPQDCPPPAMSHVLARFYAGNVVCNIGQVTKDDKRALDKLVRKGVAVKWRGYWHPVPGAPFGIGPLKTCWGLAAKYRRENNG